MKILGIDPGSQVLGYGILEALPGAPQSGVSGTIRPLANFDLCERLHFIHREIEKLIVLHRPETVAVETAFYHKNARSTLILGHVRGVVLLAARQANVTVAEYAPREVKMAVTGHGDAAKEQVAFMVRRLLALSETPVADAADALAVALCHWHRSRMRVLV
jgi:crossover junction endodeoxyribonuclease RuvC